MKFRSIDYERHFWVGAIISFLSFALVKGVLNQPQALSAVIAFVTVFVAAVGKELYDRDVKKTRFDKRDMWNTILGGSLFPALMLIASLTYYLSKP